MVHCDFIRNKAGGYGGGALGPTATHPHPDPIIINITDCLFSENQAKKGGGIFYCDNASTSFDLCLFSHNTASEEGGGIYSDSFSSPTVTDCCFQSNSAIGSGGGMYNKGLLLMKMSNCSFLNNSADTGGGIYNFEVTSQSIDHCTFSGNTAFSNGGAVCFDANDLVSQQMRNSILWGGSPDEIHYLNQAEPNVSYCDVQGGYEGTGNIDKDPLFVDFEHNDCHLTWLSPCINRGTNEGGFFEDLDGITRPVMGTVDMGVFEFSFIHALEVDTFELPETGGAIQFSLDARRAMGGEKYLIVGGFTGTVPGCLLPGGDATLPVNIDSFTSHILFPLLNSSLFQDFKGILSPDGTGHALLNSGPLPSGLTGMQLHFAYCLGWPWEFASNPVAIELIP